MISLLAAAAAAAVLVAPAGDSAQVRVNVAGLTRSEAAAALRVAARQACRALGEDPASEWTCAEEARLRAIRDYERLSRRPRPLVTASR